jgi:hypothetical protein
MQASVGRMTFTIKKKKEGDQIAIWNRLLMSEKKQPQMHFWFEMDEKYRNEIEEAQESQRKQSRLPKAHDEEQPASAIDSTPAGTAIPAKESSPSIVHISQEL